MSILTLKEIMERTEDDLSGLKSLLFDNLCARGYGLELIPRFRGMLEWYKKDKNSEQIDAYFSSNKKNEYYPVYQAFKEIAVERDDIYWITELGVKANERVNIALTVATPGVDTEEDIKFLLENRPDYSNGIYNAWKDSLDNKERKRFLSQNEQNQHDHVRATNVFAERICDEY